MTELFGGPRVTPQVADLPVGLTLDGDLPPASSKSDQYSCAYGDGERDQGAMFHLSGNPL
jgi:hypothetical protein